MHLSHDMLYRMNIVLPVRENIELRTLEINDAQMLFSIIRKNDQHLRQWLGWLDEDKSVEDIESYIKGSQVRLENKEGIDFSIWENGQIVEV